jgi:putative iron-only hydrogenase system regulator
METRIGAVIVLLAPDSDVQRVNSIISAHAPIILGRQGIPVRDRSVNVISLVVDGNTDQIGALAGQLGRLEGIRVKSVLVG